MLAEKVYERKETRTTHKHYIHSIVSVPTLPVQLSANQLRKKEGKQSALQSRRHALEQEKRRTQELAAKPQAAPMLIMVCV